MARNPTDTRPRRSNCWSCESRIRYSHFGLPASGFQPSHFVLRPSSLFSFLCRRQLFNYFSVSFSLRLHFNDKLLHLKKYPYPTPLHSHLCFWHLNQYSISQALCQAKKKILFRVLRPYVSCIFFFFSECLTFHRLGERKYAAGTFALSWGRHLYFCLNLLHNIQHYQRSSNKNSISGN